MLFALLLGGSEPASAQSATGVVRGAVSDTAGTALRGVTLRIRQTDTRRLSDATGRFLFDQLTPGRHWITATYIGAHPALDSVVIRAGETTHVRFSLRLIPFVEETLPPRYARGTRPDTAPAESETIDLVARVGRIPVLRARPPRSGRRELRFWMGGGIAIPETLIRLTIDGDRVQGQVIRYVIETIPDRDINPKWRAFMDSVPHWLRLKFECGRVTTDTLSYPGAQAGYRKELVAVCTSRYSREPDWRALLRELEAQQVWTLPDNSELPTIGNVVTLDGGGVTVEAWNGARYHTYAHGFSESPATSERRNAGAIQRALLAFLTRVH